MAKMEIRTPEAPLPSGPYSQGLRVDSRVYVAGQRPVNAETGLMPDDFEGQARQCLDNVRHVLEAAGAGMDDVVRMGVYLADLGNFAAFNAIYAEYFTAPFPVRTTIGCTLRGIQVEIDAVAELPC